jgi:hypothetical protein
MANQYSADVPKGFNVPKQVRLDSITGIQNEATLKDLGSGNNLAFKYYEGLKVYCKDEKKEYIWRQVVGVETGLLTSHFVYPTYTAVDGINYSGKSFNFFLVTNSGTPANGSETKINSGTNTTVTGLGTIASPYVINSTDTIANGSETKINEGDNITITGNGTQSTPYVINADLTDLGIIKTTNNEVIAPGQSLSIINNELTGKALATKEYVQSIIPATPNGSETKINAGTNISVTGNGTTTTPYVINSSHQDEPVYINSGDDIEVLGDGSVSNPYIINSLSAQINTKAEFNERLTDGDFLFVGDVTQYDNEQAQDAIGSVLTDTATIDFTYNDELAIISANVKPNSITSTELSNSINISEFVNDAGYITNLQKVITYPADFTGINYTLTNIDNNYIIIINNASTAVTITIPSGLTSKIGVGFIQKGTGDVTFISSGTTINNPTGLKIKGQYYQTFLEQELSTGIFYLLGNTKA